MRLDGSDLREGICVLVSVWDRVISDYPFDYAFLDADFDGMFKAEERMGGVLMAFAVLIACQGLFGLAAYAAEQRTTEVGIRKILGASVVEVVGLPMVFFQAAKAGTANPARSLRHE